MKDISSELDDYLHSTKQQQEEEEWTFDESTGAYVIHSKRSVMFNIDNQWIYGNYDSIYNNERYTFDSSTQAWFDAVTKEYSYYDHATQSYIPLTDEYWSGHPESTQSIRFVIASSPHFDSGQVAIVDEHGMSIGRDRSWDRRLRLPEMIVSKFHAMVYLDKTEKHFYIIDNGSQHGTFVNEKRLSEPKQSSLPYRLEHLDIIRIGSTSLEVHEHVMPCPSCLTSEPINIHSGKKEQDAKPVQQYQEKSAKEWIKDAKKMYGLDNAVEETNYVDRAELRRQTDLSQQKFVDPYRQEKEQELYQLQQQQKQQYTQPRPQRVQGIGNKMLQKMGWQEGQSLGKDQTGILEPIQPVSQLSRSGLGHRKK